LRFLPDLSRCARAEGQLFPRPSRMAEDIRPALAHCRRCWHPQRPPPLPEAHVEPPHAPPDAAAPQITSHPLFIGLRRRPPVNFTLKLKRPVPARAETVSRRAGPGAVEGRGHETRTLNPEIRNNLEPRTPGRQTAGRLVSDFEARGLTCSLEAPEPCPIPR